MEDGEELELKLLLLLLQSLSMAHNLHDLSVGMLDALLSVLLHCLFQAQNCARA